ncbi:MAG: hypothetical protein ACYDBQ_04145 [Thermoplasmatota archaeon]
MKNRIVNLETQDPLAKAVATEWSAKEHQHLQEKKAAEIADKRPPPPAGKRAPSARALAAYGIDAIE